MGVDVGVGVGSVVHILIRFDLLLASFLFCEGVVVFVGSRNLRGDFLHIGVLLLCAAHRTFF